MGGRGRTEGKAEGERRGQGEGSAPALATAGTGAVACGGVTPSSATAPGRIVPSLVTAPQWRWTPSETPTRRRSPGVPSAGACLGAERSLTLTAAAARGLSNFGHLQQKLLRQLREEPADSQTQGPFCRLVLCVLQERKQTVQRQAGGRWAEDLCQKDLQRSGGRSLRWAMCTAPGSRRGLSLMRS